MSPPRSVSTTPTGRRRFPGETVDSRPAVVLHRPAARLGPLIAPHRGLPWGFPWVLPGYRVSFSRCRWGPWGRRDSHSSRPVDQPTTPAAAGAAAPPSSPRSPRRPFRRRPMPAEGGRALLPLLRERPRADTRGSRSARGEDDGSPLLQESGRQEFRISESYVDGYNRVDEGRQAATAPFVNLSHLPSPSLPECLASCLASTTLSGETLKGLGSDSDHTPPGSHCWQQAHTCT